jgi:hypothetical protein
LREGRYRKIGRAINDTQVNIGCKREENKKIKQKTILPSDFAFPISRKAVIQALQSEFPLMLVIKP